MSYENDREDRPSGNLPDAFDRQIGILHDLPDVVHTKASTIRVVTPLVGNSLMYIVQTYRQMEKGDTISRQRDALGTKVRRKIGRRTAQERKDRGELPGFMRAKQTSA